jgi:hypothetical protein
MNTLVVTNPFGGHAAGDRITDPSEIESILAGGNAHDVVRAVHDDAHAAPEARADGAAPESPADPETSDTEEA